MSFLQPSTTPTPPPRRLPYPPRPLNPRFPPLFPGSPFTDQPGSHYSTTKTTTYTAPVRVQFSPHTKHQPEAQTKSPKTHPSDSLGQNVNILGFGIFIAGVLVGTTKFQPQHTIGFRDNDNSFPPQPPPTRAPSDKFSTSSLLNHFLRNQFVF